MSPVKIYTLRRKADGLYLASKSNARWVASSDSARTFGRKQDAAAALRAYRQQRFRDDPGDVEIVEHVCLPALPPDQVYVVLPVEGDGVLGDWLEAYGLLDAAMAVRKRMPDGTPL